MAFDAHEPLTVNGRRSLRRMVAALDKALEMDQKDAA